MTLYCPIDNKSKRFINFQSFKNFPLQTTPIPKSSFNNLIKKINKKNLFFDLNYVSCTNCGHIFLKNPPNQKIMNYLYKQFYNYPSPLLKEFKPERDDFFLSIFKKHFHKIIKKKNLNRLLEIGCFDGYILYNLRKQYKVCGIDPSKGANIGKKFGINIKRQFFNSKNINSLIGNHNIILFRHFLEHLKNPFKFLNICNQILNEGGFVIIEVPDVLNNLKNGSVDIFSPQHVQCFSKHTLSLILKKTGFKIKKIIAQNGNLIALAEKNNVKNINFFNFKTSFF